MMNISQLDFDHEREVAYRRGYVRGVSAVISGVAGRIPDDDHAVLAGWFGDALAKWAASSAPSCMSAPPEVAEAFDNISLVKTSFDKA